MRTKAKNGTVEFLDPKNSWRALFAETWGTFLLVLAGAGAIMTSKLTGEVSKGMEVAAPGILVMSVIYFMGTVSGAHINPVVTLAFALRRNFPWRRVPAYIIAQCIGSILAAAVLHAILGNVGDNGATKPFEGLSRSALFIIEMILTTGLVNVILGTASGPGNIGNNGALAIGGYIILAGFWAGPLTGASMNAARTLGPDIIRGNFSYTFIYISATITGAVIAVCFEWLLKGEHSQHGSEEAQGAEIKDAK